MPLRCGSWVIQSGVMARSARALALSCCGLADCGKQPANKVALRASATAVPALCLRKLISETEGGFLLQFLNLLLAVPHFAIAFHIDQLQVHLIKGNALFADLIDDGVDAAGQRKIGGGFITLRLGVAGVQLLITTLITHGITLVTSGNEIGPTGTDNGALDVVGEGINSNVFVRFVADARDDYG